MDSFFATYVRAFIYHDLQAAIDGKANYLAALGLVAYTEFMGGIMRGEFGYKKSRQNFLAFVQKYFPSCYMKADQDLQPRGGLYGVIRNGLAHEYFMKGGDASFTIYLMKTLSCGVRLNFTSYHLEFSVANYFRDFKTACETYHDDLVEGTPSLINAFRESKMYLRF